MRSRLTKLLTVLVPVIAAMATIPGSASAYSVVSFCNGQGQVVSAPSDPSHDRNYNGKVCERTNPNGKVITHDDATYLVWW